MLTPTEEEEEEEEPVCYSPRIAGLFCLPTVSCVG